MEQDPYFKKSSILDISNDIFEGDKVNFKIREFEKGPSAINISFVETVICHVCKRRSMDNLENCINCDFTLKYAKGYSAEISENDLNKYRQKLEKAKIAFNDSLLTEPINKPKKSKNQNKAKVKKGKITKGKIIFYNEEKHWGKILGEDGKEYFFHISNTQEPLKIKHRIFVNFEGIINEKKKTEAINISIKQTDSDIFNSNIINIDGENIVLKYIVSYESLTEKRYAVFCSECYGTGYCQNCDDDWEEECSECFGSGNGDWCDRCNGSGVYENGGKCYACNGSGFDNCCKCEGSGFQGCETCYGDGDCRGCYGKGIDTDEYSLEYYILIKFSNGKSRKIEINSQDKMQEIILELDKLIG
jgi:cold shock CspA family protein